MASAACRRWRIAELRVFGSALGDGFHTDSDLDLLVRFAADADGSLLDHIEMEEERDDGARDY
jgi:predicted nucleotidyltransferase